MKTDEAKQLLIALIQAVDEKRMPPQGTVELAQALLQMLETVGSYELAHLKLVNRKENIGALLIKFAELSKFGKGEWIALIQSYGLDLPLNPRDSARDVMGRLARHLRDNPDALKSIAPVEPPHSSRGSRSSKGKRPLAENLQDTLTRLLEE
jgi:hypothetical protein